MHYVASGSEFEKEALKRCGIEKIKTNNIDQKKMAVFEEISQTVKEIKEILLDPEDGLIVRVNKNTYWIWDVTILDLSTHI